MGKQDMVDVFFTNKNKQDVKLQVHRKCVSAFSKWIGGTDASHPKSVEARLQAFMKQHDLNNLNVRRGRKQSCHNKQGMLWRAHASGKTPHAGASNYQYPQRIKIKDLTRRR